VLNIQLLGTFGIMRDGKPVSLARSRKTRALLVYLAVTGHPQRRERLCELFWDVPDDPRGALRWSLSRLRAMMEVGGGLSPLMSERDSVWLQTEALRVDILDLQRTLAKAPEMLPTPVLEDAASCLRGAFLPNLDLPACHEYQSWLLTQREDLRMLRVQVAAVLAERLAAEPTAALPHARDLVNADPYAEEGWALLVRLLAATDRRSEAEQQAQAAERILQEVGGARGALLRARRALRIFPPVAEPSVLPGTPALRQEIRFCTADDDTQIAYAKAGSGPPLLKAANWMNHLEYDWENPFWSYLMRRLAQGHTLVRYDARGTGLSDGEVAELSLDAWVRDLETVVAAAGLQRFPLLGISQGCAIAIAYAARHPERVTQLILFGGYALGAHRRSAAASEESRALVTLIRAGWGQDNPAMRQMFATLFMPGGTKEQLDAFCALQRRTVSPEMAARYFEAVGHFDVRPLLGAVRAPTLVMHVREDAVTPVEQGRLMAAGIPGARFVVLPGTNHLPLEGDPGLERFFTEIAAFLAGSETSECLP
jgi:pimeloyl-ACP methyl ester carboxylesterase/DNA-binding SARP family transcriptional activator